jgi:hypothetical protein
LSIILTHEKGERLKAIPVTRMQEEFPKTYSYLSRFKEFLEKRPAFKRYFKPDAPFYSIFNIGDYTFAPWKVVWREVAGELDAAVVGRALADKSKKIVIPDHTCILVQCSTQQEAHFLCALINSSPARLAIRNYIVLHPDPHVLNNVNIPDFSASHNIHLQLAELSTAAHDATAKEDLIEVGGIEERIDQLAAKLWHLSSEELAEIKRSLEEM